MSYYGWTTYSFDPELDMQVSKCWAGIVPYSLPIRKPFAHWCLLHWDERSCAVDAEQLMVPTTKGPSWRSIGGWYYMGLRPTTDEEAKQREPLYRERMVPWIEDFGGIWRGKLVPELMAHYERHKKADLEKLSNHELMGYFEDFFMSVMKRAWEIHFLPMLAAYGAYKLFGDICPELLGIDEDHPQFHKLMGGLETIAFDVDRRLWQLSDGARELGLESLFQATPDNEGLLAALEQSEGGRKWLQQLQEFLNVHGWRNERLLDPCMPSWIEQPALALPAIRKNLAKGGEFLMDQEHDRLVKEREEAEREVLSRVPDDTRAWFEKLMRTAQWAGIYSEEHDYYIDLYMCAVGRRLLVEIGKRFAQAGVLNEPDDVNFLVPEEILRLLGRMEISIQHRVARIRREEWQKYIDDVPRRMAEEFFIGDVDWFQANVGKEVLVWPFFAAPKVKGELKADLYGLSSAPGVAEGLARVLMAVEQIPELQPGEILVTPATGPAWGPVFGIIKGVVTDAGGALSHAVIVAREYGLPCVAGTQKATTLIKTGMRLRVDGDNGVVYILG